MTKVHNFSAGPGILPAEVLKQAADHRQGRGHSAS